MRNSLKNEDNGFFSLYRIFFIVVILLTFLLNYRFFSSIYAQYYYTQDAGGQTWNIVDDGSTTTWTGNNGAQWTYDPNSGWTTNVSTSTTSQTSTDTTGTTTTSTQNTVSYPNGVDYSVSQDSTTYQNGFATSTWSNTNGDTWTSTTIPDYTNPTTGQTMAGNTTWAGTTPQADYNQFQTQIGNTLNSTSYYNDGGIGTNSSITAGGTNYSVNTYTNYNTGVTSSTWTNDTGTWLYDGTSWYQAPATNTTTPPATNTSLPTQEQLNNIGGPGTVYTVGNICPSGVATCIDSTRIGNGIWVCQLNGDGSACAPISKPGDPNYVRDYGAVTPPGCTGQTACTPNIDGRNYGCSVTSGAWNCVALDPINSGNTYATNTTATTNNTSGNPTFDLCTIPGYSGCGIQQSTNTNSIPTLPESTALISPPADRTIPINPPYSVPTLPSAPSGYCGDTICNNGETSASCQQDCPLPGGASLNISVILPGIGNKSGDNKNPKHSTRNAVIYVYNQQNQQVMEKVGPVVYNPSSFKYTGTISLGNTVGAGVYRIKIKLENTLRKAYPGIQTLTANSTLTLPDIKLDPGDFDQNNILDIKDWNILLSCIRDNQCPQKDVADLNDDGKIEEIDMNIILRSFATRYGD